MAGQQILYKTILHSIEKGEFRVSSFRAALFDLLHLKHGKYIIDAMLRAEADISTQASCSSSPQQIDIRNTHKLIVQLLVNSAENCNFYDYNKKTVLHYASEYGWLETVQSLLKKGADPNVKATDGYAPLNMAVYKSHKDVVRLLIEYGADTACGHLEGHSVLHSAVLIGSLDIAKCLVEEGGAALHDKPLLRSPFQLACVFQRIEIIEYLAKAMNLKNGCNYTLLNYIIRLCLLTANVPTALSPKLLVEMFIQRGGYLNFIDYYRLLRHHVLKQGILQNSIICTQGILNKFHNKDLPDLYKLPMVAETLPSIETFALNERLEEEIKDGVRREIETKGYCNLMKPKTIVLRMMAVKSYLCYYEGLGKKSQIKRSAVVDTDDQCGSSIKIPC